MISDDEILHLFEQADPAGGRDDPPALDAASYLEALRAGGTELTLVEIGPVPNSHGPNRRHGRRWVVAVAAAAAVVLVAGAVLLDPGRDGKTHSIVPARPGPAPTAPTPQPEDTHGLPPEGARPSLPETGELVASIVKPGCLATEGRRLFLYADGRLITPDWAYEHPTGFDERRLTAEGVDLVVAEMIATGLFPPNGTPVDGQPELDTRRSGMLVRNGDDLVFVPLETVSREAAACVAWPEEFQQLVDRVWDVQSWLPPTAWADDRPVPYVPYRYEVCMHPNTWPPVDEAAVLALPAPAGELLVGAGRMDGFGSWCADLSTAQTREVAHALEAAKLFAWHFPPLDYAVHGTGQGVLFSPHLPHGEPGDCCGGTG